MSPGQLVGGRSPGRRAKRGYLGPEGRCLGVPDRCEAVAGGHRATQWPQSARSADEAWRRQVAALRAAPPATTEGRRRAARSGATQLGGEGGKEGRRHDPARAAPRRPA